MPFLAKKRKILPYSRARSTKTRIETFLNSGSSPKSVTIREQDPLKQGLKLEGGVNNIAQGSIREQDPLKQGLKLYFTSFLNYNFLNSRARSTKTRIETLWLYNICPG